MPTPEGVAHLVDPASQITPQERRLRRREALTRQLRPSRPKVGLLLGPLLGYLAYIAMPDVPSASGDPRAAALTLAILLIMGVWWVSETVPLPVTALLPVVLFPVLGGVDVAAVTAPYGNKVIFLFLGGFVLAVGMQRWQLHTRVALRIVSFVGTRPDRLVLGFMVATAVMSMWVSNTATALMMLPIGVSVLRLLGERSPRGAVDRKLATSLMLGIAYAATIGSFGTIIGSPPNAFMVGYLATQHGITIGFGQWMMVGVPLSVNFLALAWFVLTKVVFRSSVDSVPGEADLLGRELAKLGPMGPPQWRVTIIFVLAVAGWVVRPLVWPGSPITDEVVAIAAAICFFLAPANEISAGRLLTWDDAKEIPWGVLLLFGGGLSLAEQISASGLSTWIGSQATQLGGLPTVVVVLAVCVLTVALTEFMSNTAAAATLLPIAAGVGVALGYGPLLLAMPVALGAACTFMMPAATPPNAIAYSTGYVRIQDMVRGGVILSISGMLLVTVTVMTVGRAVFGLG